MEPDRRLEIFLAAVVVVAVPLQLFDLPDWIMDLVKDVGVSFVVSGVFYVFLVGLGLGFLEDIEYKFMSAMTVAVFFTKILLI